MTTATPLQLLHRSLAPGTEAPEDAVALRAALRRLARRPRQRVVADYLIRAADARLGAEGGGGSLKHALWWLRDHAGELYEPAAHEALACALAGDWPLSAALPHLRGQVLGMFLSALEEGTDWRVLAAYLEAHEAADWRVAVNRTTLNLSKVAFRSGYDGYAANTERGAVVQARRGLCIDAAPFGPGWKQVHPNLLIWTGANVPDQDGAELAQLLATALSDVKTP